MGLAFLISTDHLQLLSERKVFKETEYAALLDASAVLDAARVEAKRITEQARHDGTRAVEEGRAEGLRRARADYAQRLASDALATQRQLHALRTSMAQIVMRALGQFMSEVDPARLLALALKRIEALVRAEPFITLRVAPTHEGALRRALEALGAECGWALAASIMIDPTLAEGACVVSTASGTLEIGLDAQLQAFRKAVENAEVPA